MSQNTEFEMMRVAYSLYYSGFDDYTKHNYAPLNYDVKKLFSDRDFSFLSNLWNDYLAVAERVKGTRKYETSNEMPAKPKKGYFLVVGTYVPLDDIEKALKLLGKA